MKSGFAPFTLIEYLIAFTLVFIVCGLFSLPSDPRERSAMWAKMREHRCHSHR